MKQSAIQIAEDLTFLFQSAADVYEKDPNQAVFVLEDILTLLNKWGLPEPDFKARALRATQKLESSEYKALMRKMGKVVAYAMKKRGISQAELAKRTGKAASVINRWTSGNANLEISTIYLIEKHLGIKLLNL